MNRRDFLINSINSLPLMISPWLTQGCLHKQQSQLNFLDGFEGDNNYIQINLYGAPSRLCFDDLLTPYGPANFLKSSGIGNSFKDDLGNIEYRVENVSGLNVPPMWEQKLELNGEKRKASELIDNTVFIRGILPSIGGHPLAGIKTVQPSLEVKNIFERRASVNKRHFPPLLIGDNPVTRTFDISKYSGLQLDPKSKNIFSSLMKSFHLPTKSGFFTSPDSSRKRLIDAINFISKDKTSSPLYKKNLTSAAEIFYDDYDALQREYAVILEKYLTHMNGSMNQELGHSFSGSLIQKISTNKFKGAPDPAEKYGRFRVNIGHFLNENFNNLNKQSNMNTWCEQFALCEFLVKKGLCSSFLISPAREMGNLLENCSNYGLHETNSIYRNQKHFRVPMDTHHTGTVINTIAANAFFRGLSAGIILLTDSLKATKTTESANLFDHTLIHLTSEFSRETRQDLSGSDHSGESGISTLISGKFKKNYSIGNIKIESEEQEGTTGKAAKVNSLGREISPKDVIHTVYNILGMEPDYKRSVSLLKKSKGNFIPSFETAKNI